MRIRLLTLLLLLFPTLWAEQTVTVSNLRPRTDTDGQILDVHEGCLVPFNNTFYWYGMAYGANSAPFLQSYSSSDFARWKKEGKLLLNAPAGRYARPQVAYNAKSKSHVLWYLWSPQPGPSKIGVAVSTSPTGPFKIVNADVKLAKSGEGVADIRLFVDDDGTAYLSYSTVGEPQGWVEKLRADYLSSTLENGGCVTEGCDAGSLFKREGKYYLLADVGNRSGTQGSGVRVYVSDKPMSGYLRHNDINRFPGTPAPMLVDGVLSPNLFATVRKNSDGAFPPVQLNFQGDSTFNTIKVIQFTGNRKSSADSTGAVSPEPILAPSFEVQYWKNGYWIPVRISEKAMSSSVYTLLDLRFEPVRTRRLRVLTNKNYPYNLMINEIEVSENQQVLSGGAQAFLIDQEPENCLPQIPGRTFGVLPLQTADGLKFLWLADLWGSASDNMRGHDYQYLGAPLEFDPKGDIDPMKWVDTWRLRLP